MEDEGYWAAVRDMRLRVADLLASLAPAQWNAHRCAGGGGSVT